MSRVVFKISGSFDIGYGHIRRCMTLAQELQKQIGREAITFFCECPDPKAEELFGGFRVVLNEPEGLVDFLKENKTKTVVFDELYDNIGFCWEVKTTVPDVRTICLDYFNYDNEWADCVINLFNHNHAVPDPQAKIKGRYLQSLDYAIIRDSFTTWIGKEKDIRPIVDKVLITFGGADMSGHTLEVLKLLGAIGYRGHVDVVIGPFFKNVPAIEEMARNEQYKTKVHVNVPNLEEFMFKADCGFIGSGTTIMESCAVGLPVLVMPQNAREADFAGLFVPNKAAHIIKAQDHKTVQDIFSQPDERESMSRAGKRLVDGEGVRRICRLILDR